MPDGSSLVGITLRDANLRQRAGRPGARAARRRRHVHHQSRPDTVLRAHQVIIAVGTEIDLDQLLDTVRT